MHNALRVQVGHAGRDLRRCGQDGAKVGGAVRGALEPAALDGILRMRMCSFCSGASPVPATALLHLPHSTASCDGTCTASAQPRVLLPARALSEWAALFGWNAAHAATPTSSKPSHLCKIEVLYRTNMHV